jgi:hypothetical protein
VDLRPYYQQMLDELDSGWLDVVLVPSRRFECYRRGGMVRVCQGQNADWYRKLCAKYSSSRTRKNHLHDTRIKRANVRSTLKVLIAGRKTPSYLVPDLKREAERLENEDFVPF